MVKRFTLQEDYPSKFGSYGGSCDQFNNPQGLAYYSKGLLNAVCCITNCRVKAFDHSNTYIFEFGSKGSI